MDDRTLEEMIRIEFEAEMERIIRARELESLSMTMPELPCQK